MSGACRCIQTYENKFVKFAFHSVRNVESSLELLTFTTFDQAQITFHADYLETSVHYFLESRFPPR